MWLPAAIAVGLLLIRYSTVIAPNKPTPLSVYLQDIALPFCAELTVTTPDYLRHMKAIRCISILFHS
jgi:hypothetical protein